MHSDSRGPNAVDGVRIRRAFGTAKDKSQVMVTESGMHSDSKGQIAGDGVRTRHAFGQERPNRRWWCPN
ncbi:hypothetical protein [Cytobacillus pseudoceanisediminis]|uniref:hypothetical protein n=1 Tax=Cytobacillus pseudoceanisediminis TaxID=3051614 RepID=UPI003C2EFBAE